MTDARREPLTRYWVDKHRLVDEQASVDISSVPNSLCVVLASDYDALDDRLAASETVPEEVQQQVREETKCTEDVSTWSKAVAILIDDSQHWSKHSLTQLCEENHTLKQRLAESEKEVTEIRGLLGCHRAYIQESIRDLQAKTEDIPNIDRIHQAEQRLAEMEQWVQSRGERAIVDITGDPEDVLLNKPSIESCQKAIDAHMDLGIKRNNELVESQKTIARLQREN